MNDFIYIANNEVERKREIERESLEREARHEAAIQEGYKNMRQGQKMRELRCKAHKWDITEKCLAAISVCLMLLTLTGMIALAQII